MGAGYIGLELGMAYRKAGRGSRRGRGGRARAARLRRGTHPARARRAGEERRRAAPGLQRAGYDAQHGVRVRSARADEFCLPADRVLVAVGRKPRTTGFGLESLQLDMAGRYVAVDAQCRTSMRNVWAIGDITTTRMLAHRAMAQGEVVAEVIAGKPALRTHGHSCRVLHRPRGRVGQDAGEARAARAGLHSRAPSVRRQRPPMTLETTGGFVRVVARKDNHLILGWRAISQGVAELAAAFTQSIEMGARLEDVAGTIHAHPHAGRGGAGGGAACAGARAAHLTHP